MDINLTGKNALVCGSSRGIGKAAAKELAELGANVTLVSRSGDLMADIIRQMADRPGQQHDFLVADFTNRQDLRRKVSGLTSRKTIHILVNNTGGPPGGPILNAGVEEFMEAFQNHLLCYQLLVKAVVKGMKTSGYGRIINVISTSVKQPIQGLGVSNTIRGAVANWAKTLANELGPSGITVNNVLPGTTETSRLREIIEAKVQKTGLTTRQVEEQMKLAVPLGRFAEPEEIGAAVAFLATPAAGYITGTNITVDGGRTKSL